MNIAIMQPYFLPYIGYWQLLKSVDKYVSYDNIKFTKGSWINRNRYLLNGKDKLFSIPLNHNSDYLNIVERFISESFNKKKLINQLFNSYKKAPCFKNCFNIIEDIINYDEKNLFLYNLNSIKKICWYLDIKTEIIVSSNLKIDHSTFKAQDKVLVICKDLQATKYINAIGGTYLYEKNIFKNNGIILNFIKTNNIIYKQFDKEFVPNLSIIDIMMFNSQEDIKKLLNEYELIEGLK